MNTTLRKMVGQFLGSSDQSSHQFLRLFNLGKLGLEMEFNLTLTGTVKTEILCVNGNKTVNLPCNYITYLKIGVLNNKGEVVTYKRNDQLSTLITNCGADRTAGAPVVNSSTVLGPYTYDNLYYNNYWLNGVGYKLYGAPSGTITRGEYKVDEKARIIFLSPDTCHDKIVLEYLCDGYDQGCDDHEIDIRAAKCFMAYLRWVNAQDLPKKFSTRDVDYFMKQYYREKRLSAMMMNPFKLNELQDAIRVGTKLASKA